MSRRAGYAVIVAESADGTPLEIRRAGEEGNPSHPPASRHPAVPVLQIMAYHREWIGVLDGEPERDIFLVETPDGICELHRLRDPARAAAEGSTNHTAVKETVTAAREGEKPTAVAAVSSLSQPVPDRWLLARWED